MRDQLLTIITPVYNRKELLFRCADSLNKQTCSDFQWIIIDDGSSDGLEDEIRSFVECSHTYIVEYYKKKNGGKHTALNYSHPFIKGKYVLLLDSDDILTPNAVETVLKEWQNYETQEQIGIITFLKGKDTEHPNAYAPDERVPVNIMGYKRVCLNGQDCCEVIRTDLFKQFPFPEFAGEKFISEGALWNRVSLTHKCIYINKVIYLCDYLDDGLTKSGKPLRIHNPNGGMYTSALRMHSMNNAKDRIKAGILYDCYGFFAGRRIPTILNNTNDYINNITIVKIICMLPGYVLYRYWKKKYW